MPKHAIWINDMRLDPATAEFIAVHPGGDRHFTPEQDGYRRFDEHLYRNPEGYWFVVRPLAPDEARVWMLEHNDEVLLQRTFPDEDEG